MIKGLSLGVPMDASDTRIVVDTQDVDTLRALGCTVARVACRLQGKDHWDAALLACYKAVIGYLHAHGLKVHLLVEWGAVAHATQEAWDAPITTLAYQGFRSQYLAALGLLVPLGADWIEVGNEPNDFSRELGHHPWGATYMQPACYADLLAHAFGTIKKTAPRIRVVFGGLFSHTITGASEANSGSNYLGDVLSRWGANTRRYPYFDDVGWHPYLEQGGRLDPTLLDTYRGYYAQHTSAPLLVSECGWRTKNPATPAGEGLPPDVQAGNCAALGAWCAAQGIPFLWFQLQDQPETPPAGLFYGLKWSLLTTKPSFAAFGRLS